MTPPEADLLLLGGTLVTMNECMDVIDDCGLAISDGTVVAAGSCEDIVAAHQAAETIDTHGRLIMPGLVNTHTHTPMMVLRGLTDDLALMEWLQSCIWPWEHRHINPETVRINSQLALAEMVKAGITTFNDMYFYGTVTARLARQAGMRAVVAEPYAEGGPYGFNEAMRALDAFIDEFNGDPLVIPAVGPHSAYACTREQLVTMSKAAERYGAPIHVHISETADEVERVTADRGARPPAYLDSLGLLKPTTIAAHCIHVDDPEVDLLARRGVAVSHTPQCEMKLSSGIAPIRRMLDAGMTVGLGTDGASSNNVLDILQEIKAAALLHKVASGDPTVLDARSVVRMATVDGAAALGLGELTGSLEPGKRADVIVLDMDAPHAVPCYDPFSHLAYAARAADVRTVLIDGRVVMRERALETIDEQRAIAEVRGLMPMARSAAEPPERPAV